MNHTRTSSVSTLLLPFLLLAACSGAGDEIADEVHKMRGGGNSPIESLKLADFQCTTANCPKNVGLLVSNQFGSGPATGQCTGFLVANDIVATNSHCIPNHLKASYTTPDCSRYLAIRFQPDAEKELLFKCKTMLDFSVFLEDSVVQDFAFFKIEPTGRTPFRIHKQGIKHNQNLTVQKVTPLKHSLGGRLSVQKCRNIQNSFVYMEATNPWSSTGAVVGCDVQSGNSGSPIVDTSGAVVGIAQAMFTEQHVDRLKKDLKQIDISFEEFPTHALFTNLSCVKDPVTNRINKEMCDKANDVVFAQCMRPAPDLITAKIREEISKLEVDLAGAFIYEIRNAVDGAEKKKDEEEGSSSLVFTADPICVKADRSQSIISEKNILDRAYISSVLLEANFAIDLDLRILPDATTFKKTKGWDSSINLAFNKDKKLWVGHKEILSDSEIVQRFLGNIKFPIEIPDCSKGMIEKGNLVSYTNERGESIPFEDYSSEKDLDEEEVRNLATCKELGAM